MEKGEAERLDIQGRVVVGEKRIVNGVALWTVWLGVCNVWGMMMLCERRQMRTREAGLLLVAVGG
jgi:hypothetical protein